MDTICPKCDYKRTKQDDPTIPDFQCPSCGIVYVKYIARREAESANNRSIDLGGGGQNEQQTSNGYTYNSSRPISLPVLLTLLIIAGAGWKSYKSPSNMMNDLRETALDGDADELNEYIDFSKLRQNVRTKVKARIHDEMEEASDNPYSKLAQSMALGMLDSSINAFISPDNLKKMIIKGAEMNNTNNESTIDYPVTYTSMNSVIIPIRGVNYYLERSGFFSWKLIDIDDPK